MTLICGQCGRDFERPGRRGTIPTYCTANCRYIAHRRRHGMKERAVFTTEEERYMAALIRQRRRRGHQGKITRPFKTDWRLRDRNACPRIDSVPFVAWLRHHPEAVIDSSQRSKLLGGNRPKVSLDVVDRALLDTDTGLWELYPELCE